jgi:acyl transferase domain-containing protein
VKTNIGHLEAAAGMMGLIKTVIALGRHEIPPHLHLRTRNPLIDWKTLPITIPAAVMPWTPIEGRRIAGVSSFGFSGTNAHVVLEEAPAGTDPGMRREDVRSSCSRSPRETRTRSAHWLNAIATRLQLGRAARRPQPPTSVTRPTRDARTSGAA